MPHMKVPALTVRDKNVFKDFTIFLCRCEIRDPTTLGQFSHLGHNLKYFGRGSLDDVACQKSFSPYGVGQEDFFLSVSMATRVLHEIPKF